MGLAVPAALTVAVGRGAQLGVLFKGGEALERLGHLDAIVLDKTGTLTVGRPVLEAMHPLEGQDEENLVRIAAAAEERSNHPLAHAMVDYARGRGMAWPAAEDVQILPGRGLTARVDGRECMLGNEALFQEFFIELPRNVPPADPGVTRLWMALDSTITAYFDARDALRPDAAEAVAALRHDGLRVVMLTGDSAAAAEPIARQAGITEVEASLDPAGKLARIRALQASGLRVAMVGDGINDAGALAQADAGIAMGTGADLAQEAGDVLLLRAQPSSIPAALELARSTLRVMRQNLVWAAAYNVLGIPLAAGLLYPGFHILLSPWIAAAAMAFSSVSVLGNSLRLRAWQPASLVPPRAGSFPNRHNDARQTRAV
jgi:Cu+-exporting ATPase